LAFTANAAFVLLSTLGILMFGNRILLLWGGDAISRSGAPLLPIVVWSSALLSLNVTGSYAMLALGRVQAVTWLNLAAGGTMLLLIAWLLPRYGMIGFAEARLIHGSITLLIYIPLALYLRPGSLVRLTVSTRVPTGEEA
jgi:O-antigen/teichoic acid export membrane protein